MKLVYTQNKNNSSDTVHRFEVLGDFNLNDLDVLKNSLFVFIGKFEHRVKSKPIMIIDFSECSVKLNETMFQEFITEIKTQALASGISISIAQSDIESIHAENKAVELALLSKINLLENKLNLIENVKNSILTVQLENELLREKLKTAESKKGARGIFEKLWSEN